ncbi:methylated-DNA--[protein]-cysteine S-methyltransferase [Shinella zoogloeoides]|uniref:methylated-DNA--[protein]-cysteine S-methyltransferase n=1 Tax=Shinella zoogloeoides TaxID=352475 RepID=UPI00299DA5DC|nr:methylated-DNA--[protein]-cysteine S-methyltransferase [Shinella zoogloeoides]WPE22204.1 Methylated-DNA--protein-cysteine methyltransferase [Shinella zoogloeoides]
MTGKTQYHIFETASGPCGIAWTAAGVVRFQLPGEDAARTQRLLLRRLENAEAAEPAEPPPAIARAIEAAQRYFAGEEADFTDVPLDLAGQSEFFRAIYDAARRVHWGETTTYGTIARDLGAGPEGAREVGQAMAKNPVALIIPCHRVLAAGNKVGGFSAPGGASSKVKMLALEGISFAPPEPAQQSFGF